MKKLFILAAVIAVSVFGVIKANDLTINSKMTELQMENIEALAQEEPKAYCPYGIAEYYVAQDPEYNNSHSVFCDCTSITFFASRRTCDGKTLCSDNTWNILIHAGR